ncbi:hypothetical protein [Nocardioides sp. GXZ039]|uniref:hypothetical protein n=1 Tax=Nocardioides sp. GXZ039 TaxID=3136018 RepID=UPI0030F48CAE
MRTATTGEIATLAHGYSMADVEHFTRAAASRRRFSTMLDWGDRHEVAWFAIIELLYTTSERPTRYSLINAGANAIDAAINQELHHHGVRNTTYELGANAEMYWLAITAPPPDFTDRVVERLALPQLLSLLTPKQYEAVAALAVHGDLISAAESLGLKMTTLHARVAAAREVLTAAWHAPETPRRRRSRSESDDVCTWGHDRATHTFRDPKTQKRICRACRRSRERRRSDARRAKRAAARRAAEDAA